MPRPILVGLALREDDAAPLALARVPARLTGAPLALLTALPHEAPGLVPVPESTLALQRDAAGASEHADLLVCGSRGYGALRSVLAGGVSRGLAQEARCPLLVVPRSAAAPASAVAA